jgi:hypothetical protein
MAVAGRSDGVLRKGIRMRAFRMLVVVSTLFLFGAAGARGAALYKIDPIVKLGDKVSNPPIKTSTGLWVGSLNDSGQIAFVSGNSAGGSVLFRYAGGQITPIAAAGQEAPTGKWPSLAQLWSPVSMNQAGNIVFSLADQPAGAPVGTFEWNATTQQVSTIAQKGMPASGNLTLLDGGGPIPTINNQNEIAFVADVKNRAGETKSGVFFLGRDGLLQPVALPDQTLPNAICQSATYPSVNNAGAVAFLATPKGSQYASAYLWENGQSLPVATVGTQAPGGGGIIAAVWGAWVNNKNHNVLVEASVKSPTAAHSLFLFNGGQLNSAVLAGKPLPDGVNMKTVDGGVSAGNDAGEHVFIVTRSDGSTAAYMIDEYGTVFLLLKSTTSTDPGAIARVGEASTFGAAINNKGQIALVIRYAGARSSTLVLMTP